MVVKYTGRVPIYYYINLKNLSVYNVVNGVSRSHKTVNKFFFHLTKLHSLLTGMYILVYETPLQGNSLNNNTY